MDIVVILLHQSEENEFIQENLLSICCAIMTSHSSLRSLWERTKKVIYFITYFFEHFDVNEGLVCMVFGLSEVKPLEFGRHAELFLSVRMNSYLISPWERKEKENALNMKRNLKYVSVITEKGGTRRGWREELISSVHLCDKCS